MTTERTAAPVGKRGRKRRRGGYPWPAVLVLGAIALLALALYAAYQGGGSAPAAKGPSVPVTASGRPAVKSDRQLIDLGYAKLDKPVRASFQIQNAGDQPLRITAPPYIEVLEGCWPPTPAIGAMVLNPGESTTLSMEFMMHAGMEGPHNFLVHVKTNDPQQPDLTMNVLSDWGP